MNIEKVIVALDVDTADEAFALVDKLPQVDYFKVGWQLFANEGINIVQGLGEYGAKVFVDLKIDDIPNTVEKAVRTLTQFECVKFFTFQGDDDTLDACRQGSRNTDIQFLFVPTLSSRREQEGLANLMHPFIMQPHILDGIIASGDTIFFAHKMWPDWTIVAPGIRLLKAHDDHQEVTTPMEAFQSGASYIVVGREITTASDPQKVLNTIL